MALHWSVAVPLLAALLIAAIGDRRRDLAAWLAALATLTSATLLVAPAITVWNGAIAQADLDWLPWNGATLGFRLDGLALLFALLVLGIGLLVILYARYYLGPKECGARFHAYFMAFMGAMLGVVLAGNLLLIVVLWELTSLASFLLIGFWRERADARRGARMALTITGTGGLCLLGGVLLLGQIAGSFDLDVVLASGESIRADPLYAPMLLLVLLGVFTKSAQFPFHFWLPAAMAAPTPVSAYLHSATMVKAGVFLLARLHPAIAGTELWFGIVTIVGLLTLLAGAYMAVFEHDLKGLLAYSTISHLGLITLLFGLDTPLASVAGVFHILNHATFKASLFMAAGIIDHETGSRDMRRVNGLWRYMPVTAVLAIVASSAMAGVPLLNGFLSKEMFFAQTLGLESHAVLRIAVPLCATLAAAFSVAYSMRFIHDVFWNGEPRGLARMPHEPPAWMLVPVGILALLCLLVGMLPGPTIGGLLEAGARSVVGAALPAYSLAIWHGLNLPLVMGMIALLVGVAFYFSLQRLFNLHDTVHLPRGGRELFDVLMRGVLEAARRIGARLPGARLQPQLVLVVLAALSALSLPLLARIGALPLGEPASTATPAPLLAWLLALLACAAALGVVLRHHERFEALIWLGVTGLAVSLAFALLSAPDLALTQLLVEVASVLMMTLALRRLPARAVRDATAARRASDALVAIGAGVLVALVAHAVLTHPGDARLAEWLLANAVPGAAGTNAVNVIIVDFRALDTLGEVAVLGIAALVVAALVGRATGPPDLATTPLRPPAQATSARERALLLEAAAPWVALLATLVALWFYLRGHNLPGGGFIAGLTLALGLLVVRLEPRLDDERTLRGDDAPERWIGRGLLVIVLTGAGSFALAHPFLTSAYLAPELPWIGKVSIATAMFFDLGVFAIVTGATMLALAALGRFRAGAAS